MKEAQHASDGIIESISTTLDKVLYNVVNKLPITSDNNSGISNACVAACKLFEGSGIDDDLEKIKALLFSHGFND